MPRVISEEEFKRSGGVLGGFSTSPVPAANPATDPSGKPLGMAGMFQELPTSTKPTVTSPKDEYVEKRPWLSRLKQFAKEKVSTGIVGGIVEDVKTRAGDVKETFGRVWEEGQNPLSTGIQVAGAGAGLVGDVIGRGITSAYKAVTPESAQKVIEEKAIALAKKAGLPEVMGQYEEWSKKHPEAAANLEGVVNIASLFPAERAATGAVKATVKVGAPIVEKTAGRAALAVEKKAAKSVVDKALDVTKPILTKTEKEAAILAGRGEKGILGTTIKPSTKDIQVAESVADVITGKNPFKDIAAVKEKIKQTSERIRTVLGADNRGYNKNQVKTALQKAKEKSRIVFGSDKTQQSAYDSVVDEMLRHVDDNPQHLQGLWDARIGFDDVIDEKFPGLLGGPAGDNARKNAVKDVRRTLNEFIDTNAPDSEFAKGMKEITNMYDASDRIAAKAVETVDKNIVQRVSSAISKHPIIGAGSFLGLGAVGTSLPALIANPAVLSSLAAYGTYKLGKKIITSKAVRDGVSTVLRTVEKGAAKLQGSALQTAKEEASALKKILDVIPD